MNNVTNEISSVVELDTPQMIMDNSYNWIEARFGVSRLYSTDLSDNDLLRSPCNLQGGSYSIKEHHVRDSIRNNSVTDRLITYNNYNKIQIYDNPILLVANRVTENTILPHNVILNVNDIQERNLMSEVVYNKLFTTERKVNEIQRSSAIFNIINNDVTIHNNSLDSSFKSTSLRIMDISLNPSLPKPVDNIIPKYIFYKDTFRSIDNRLWEFYTLETIELNPNLPVKTLKYLCSPQLIEYICNELQGDFLKTDIKLPLSLSINQMNANTIFDMDEDVTNKYSSVFNANTLDTIKIEVRDITKEDCFNCVARYPDIIIRDNTYLDINDFLAEDNNVLSYIDYLDHLNKLGSGVYYSTPNIDITSMAKVHIEAVTNLHNSNLVMAVTGSSFENIYSILFSLISKPAVVYDYLYNHTTLAKEVSTLLDNMLYALESSKGDVNYLDLVRYLKETLDSLLMYKESNKHSINNLFYGRNMFQGYLNSRNPALIVYILCNLVTTLTLDLVMNSTTSVLNKPIITGTLVNTYSKLYPLKVPYSHSLKLFKHLGVNIKSILLYNTSLSLLNTTYTESTISEKYSDISIINCHSNIHTSDESELIFDSILDKDSNSEQHLEDASDNTLKAQKMIYTNIQKIINDRIGLILKTKPICLSDGYIAEDTAHTVNNDILSQFSNIAIFSLASNTMVNMFNKTCNIINNFNTNYLSNLLPNTCINCIRKGDTKDTSQIVVFPRQFFTALINNSIYPDVRLTTKTDLDYKRRRITTGTMGTLTQSFLNNALSLHSNLLNGLSVNLLDRYFDYSNNEVVLTELQMNNYFKSIIPGIVIDANEEYSAKIMQEILDKLSNTLQSQNVSAEVKELAVIGLVDMWSKYYSDSTQTLKHTAYDILLRQLDSRFISDSKDIRQSSSNDVYLLTGNTTPIRFKSRIELPVMYNSINLDNLDFLERKVGVRT